MKVIVDNLAVEYKDEGSGPVLLLLHGWGNNLSYFDNLCSVLRGFRFVRLDLPGFGNTERPKRAWTVQDYAQFVAAFCEKLQIEPEIIVGHSLGGRILTKGVGEKIINTKKLILLASAGVAARKTTRNMLYAAAAKGGKILLKPLPKTMYEQVRRKLYNATGSDYMKIEDMSETFLNMIQEDLSDDASNIGIPTLLIWGKEDAVTPLVEGEKLHSLIQGSKLVVIPEAGHFVHLDHSEVVASEIQKFI